MSLAKIAIVGAWYYLSFWVLYNTIYNQPVEVAQVTAYAKNAICRTYFDRDEYICNVQLTYNYDNIEYIKKTNLVLQDVPVNGDRIPIEIRKEDPGVVINPLDTFSKYKYGKVWVLLSIVVTIISATLTFILLEEVCSSCDNPVPRQKKNS